MSNTVLRPTIAKVDLTALIANYKSLQAMNQDAFFCPMVKANAYGHGDIEVVKALSPYRPSAFGVGLIEEGIRIRSSGLRDPILFFGAINKNCLEPLKTYQITPVISDWEQLELVKKTSARIKVHIKVNTGMHRYGFSLDELEKLKEALALCPNVFVKGVMSHLASGEDFWKQNSYSEQQLKKFLSGVQILNIRNKIDLHLFNTTGIVSYYSKGEGDQIKLGARPGIGLYGYSPDAVNEKINLKPILSLHSKVVHINRVRAGDTVSYGRSWQAKRDSLIGVVPIGYADGLPRALSNKGRVLVFGYFAPIVGNVTMDNIMIDLTDAAEAESCPNLIGIDVILLGQDNDGNSISVTEWARQTGTIEWEVLTSLSERIPRLFFGGSSNEKKNH